MRVLQIGASLSYSLTALHWTLPVYLLDDPAEVLAKNSGRSKEKGVSKTSGKRLATFQVGLTTVWRREGS